MEHITVKKLNAAPVTLEASVLYFIKHDSGDLEVWLTGTTGEVVYKSLTRQAVIDAVGTLGSASTSEYGVTKLYDGTDSNDAGLAATAHVAKVIYDAVTNLDTKVNNAIDSMEKMRVLNIFALAH